MSISSTPIALENIQGNILGGFLKDHRLMLFLQFTDPEGARQWLKKMACNISSSEEVIAFNQLFKLIRAKKGIEGVVKATWTNIAFTYTGLKKLGISDYYLKQFPDVFKAGMAARAKELGDTGPSAPDQWVGHFGDPDRIVHAMLLVEADELHDLNATAEDYRNQITANGTVSIVFEQRGATLPNPLTGHEHFGFKDGVSQPGIRGIDASADPGNPNQGNPGQDLLHPGEFVLGYPTQIAVPDPAVDGPNPNPGTPSVSGPPWTKDGSYLVFRRLGQDVKKFHDNVEALTAASPIKGATRALIGAKLVGRYASGCPVEQLKSQTGDYAPPFIDPGIAHPQAANDDAINNFFEYSADPLGDNVPRAAHIRKAYPRDQVGTVDSGTDSESRTQTHRLLRRGLPYGKPYVPVQAGQPKDGEGENDERGLLFLCYQKDIESQFEFVQRAWVNDADFPCPAAAAARSDDGGVLYTNGQPPNKDGQDPVIATSRSGPFFLSDSRGNERLPEVSHFVTTTGGDYFFSPSLSALVEIADDAFSN